MIKRRLQMLEQNNALCEKLSEALGVSKLIAQCLINRDVTDYQQAKEFLEPRLDHLYDPLLMKGMGDAVQLVKSAMTAQQTIMIYGDYDVDGITSTVLLCSVLSELGAKVDYYIPDRLTEGYGLKTAAVEEIAANGTDFLITVDCGISAIEEVTKARELGMMVIITDHHEPGTVLPPANVIINPKQRDCTYPFKGLAGVGVAFKFGQALWQAFNRNQEGYLKRYLDLTALGTIADVVPLLNENRIIVKFGLPLIGDSVRPGIQALLKVAGVAEKTIDANDIGYRLGPRLNAAGRLAHARVGVELLTADDGTVAADIAQSLNDLNSERQALGERILREALELLATQVDMEHEKVIVIAGEDWHHGVTGIVASRLTEMFYRPTLLISFEEAIGRGSARSISGFNLYEALTECRDYLSAYGGHALAAGLTLERDNLDAFRQAINTYADAKLQPEDLVPQILVDAELKLAEINLELINELQLLAPFGMDNPAPLFVSGPLYVAEARAVGNEGQHLKLKVRESSCQMDGIAFQMGKYSPQLTSGQWMKAVFIPQSNSWNGEVKLQINIQDIQLPQQIVNSSDGKLPHKLNHNLCEVKQQLLATGLTVVKEIIEKDGTFKLNMPLINQIAPERAKLRQLYLVLRQITVDGEWCCFETDELVRIFNKYTWVSVITLWTAFVIFQELKLLEAAWTATECRILLKPTPNSKLDLYSSPSFRRGMEIREEFLQLSNQHKED